MSAEFTYYALFAMLALTTGVVFQFFLTQLSKMKKDIKKTNESIAKIHQEVYNIKNTKSSTSRSNFVILPTLIPEIFTSSPFFKPDVVEETSIWQSIDNQVQPQFYSFERTGGKKDKFMALNFDWQADRLHIDDGKQPWQLKLEHGTLDKLVYQIALMSDLKTNKQQFNYRIADGGKLKTYDIRIITEEVIKTPLGKINTVKLIRYRSNNNKRQTTLWCAPALNYLPVKLEHTEKGGSVFTALLRKLDGITTTDAFMPLSTKTDNFKQFAH